MLVDPNGRHRYIPVTETGDENGTLDDVIDFVHRFAFGDPTAGHVRRRWGMPLDKFLAIQAALNESDGFDKVLRATILKALGLEDIPPKQRKRRSDGHN